MSRRRRALLLAGLFCASLAVACTDRARVESLQMVALGTVFSISIADPKPGWRAAAENTVASHLARWESDMYPYRDGELARANAAFVRGDCVEPSPLLRSLIEAAQTFERRHPGLFNAALAEDTRRWGFDQLGIHDAPKAPTAAAAVTRSSSLNLDTVESQVCASGPVALDFGGFAKGFIVDELLDALTALGHTNTIVNVGGDLRVRGQRPGGPWRVAIRDPHRPGPLAGLAVRDGESVFTSGNYERHIDRHGLRYAHIFDPLTGEPLTGIASVTVLGADPASTDAATTALYVAAARAITRRKTLIGIQAVADTPAFLIIDDSGHAWLNNTMLKRLNWTDKAPKFTIISTENPNLLSSSLVAPADTGYTHANDPRKRRVAARRHSQPGPLCYDTVRRVSRARAADHGRQLYRVAAK